jgi:hypothetical protein
LADGVDELVRAFVLGEVALRACQQGHFHPMRLVVHGEHEDPNLRAFHANSRDEFQAAACRQRKVYDGEVRAELADLREGLLRILCLAADNQVGLHTQQQVNPSANDRVVFR